MSKLEYMQANEWDPNTETVVDDPRPTPVELGIRAEGLKISIGEVERMLRAVKYMRDQERDMGFRSDLNQIVQKMEVLLHNLKVELDRVRGQLELA